MLRLGDLDRVLERFCLRTGDFERCLPRELVFLPRFRAGDLELSFFSFDLDLCLFLLGDFERPCLGDLSRSFFTGDLLRYLSGVLRSFLGEVDNLRLCGELDFSLLLMECLLTGEAALIGGLVESPREKGISFLNGECASVPRGEGGVCLYLDEVLRLMVSWSSSDLERLSDRCRFLLFLSAPLSGSCVTLLESQSRSSRVILLFIASNAFSSRTSSSMLSSLSRCSVVAAVGGYLVSNWSPSPWVVFSLSLSLE